MSYDIAYWQDSPKCKYDAYAIYCRVRRGLPVEGLKKLPKKRITSALTKLLENRDTLGDALVGNIGDASLEISVLDHAILIDYRGDFLEAIDRVNEALREFSLIDFDPQQYQGPEEELLDDLDYYDKSGDPDPGYWVDANFVPCTEDDPQVYGCGPCSIQRVHKTTYILIETDHEKGGFRVADAIAEDRCNTVLSDAFGPTGGGNLSQFCPFIVLMLLPIDAFEDLGKVASLRMHCTVFCAFGFDARRTEYREFSPDDQGRCCGLFSLPARPTRLKTMISTKYVYKG